MERPGNRCASQSATVSAKPESGQARSQKRCKLGPIVWLSPMLGARPQQWHLRCFSAWERIQYSLQCKNRKLDVESSTETYNSYYYSCIRIIKARYWLYWGAGGRVGAFFSDQIRIHHDPHHLHIIILACVLEASFQWTDRLQKIWGYQRRRLLLLVAS